MVKKTVSKRGKTSTARKTTAKQETTASKSGEHLVIAHQMEQLKDQLGKHFTRTVSTLNKTVKQLQSQLKKASTQKKAAAKKRVAAAAKAKKSAGVTAKKHLAAAKKVYDKLATEVTAIQSELKVAKIQLAEIKKAQAKHAGINKIIDKFEMAWNKKLAKKGKRRTKRKTRAKTVAKKCLVVQREPFNPAELLLNGDGSVYHLKLKPEQLASTVILVGDPERVSRVSERFDRVEYRVQRREFITHTGTLRGMPISCLSTGIGMDNIDIVLNELDALVNFDLKSRTINETIKSLHIIRLGTAGSLHSDIPLNSMVIAKHAFCLEGPLTYYQHQYSDEQQDLLDRIVDHLKLKSGFSPRMGSASEELFARLEGDCTVGLNFTCSGFFGAEGRDLRLPLRHANLLDELTEFNYRGQRVLVLEMETAAIYGLSNLLGHRCCSVSTVIDDRASGQLNDDPDQAVDRMIDVVLDRLTQ